MRTVLGMIAALALVTLAPAALAQSVAEQVSAAEAVAPPPAPQAITIPAGAVVQVELTEALSSRSSQQEQTFGLRLVEPIIVNGIVVAPAGALGGGEVIDAHPSAFGGRQGRLIVSGRYVEINGQRARIRGMQITAAGEQRTNTALAVSMIPYAGVAGIFIQGGEVDIPIGARGTARLAEAIEIPVGPIVMAISEPVPPAVIEQTQPAPTPAQVEPAH